MHRPLSFPSKPGLELSSRDFQFFAWTQYSDSGSLQIIVSVLSFRRESQSENCLELQSRSLAASEPGSAAESHFAITCVSRSRAGIISRIKIVQQVASK